MELVEDSLRVVLVALDILVILEVVEMVVALVNMVGLVVVEEEDLLLMKRVLLERLSLPVAVLVVAVVPTIGEEKMQVSIQHYRFLLQW